MENSKVQKHIKNEMNLPGNQENQCALYLPPSPGKSLNTNMVSTLLIFSHSLWALTELGSRAAEDSDTFPPLYLH